jgi:hypothetical protein
VPELLLAISSDKRSFDADFRRKICMQIPPLEVNLISLAAMI